MYIRVHFFLYNIYEIGEGMAITLIQLFLILISFIAQLSKCYLSSRRCGSIFRCYQSLDNLPPVSNYRDQQKARRRRILKSIVGVSHTIIMVQTRSVLADTTVIHSDEFAIEILNDYLGINLKEISYKNEVGVIVQSVRSNADESIKKMVKPNMIVVAIGGTNVEGRSGKEVVQIFKSASKPTEIVLRDPALFFKSLNSSTFSGSPASVLPIITTALRSNRMASVSVIPSSSSSSVSSHAEINVLTIERIEMPVDATTCARVADAGDVVEIAYTVAGVLNGFNTTTTAALRDGATGSDKYTTRSVLLFGSQNATEDMASGDNSYFFVLGKSPKTLPSVTSAVGGVSGNTTSTRTPQGQKTTSPSSAAVVSLPDHWDAYSIRGMCVGERRRVTLPRLLLGQQQQGTKTALFNSLVLDVKLLSINGFTDPTTADAI